MILARRRLLSLLASAAAVPALAGRAAAAEPGPRIREAIARFAALPATASCLVIVDHPTAPWRAEHDPRARLFVGSAVKSFILAQYLRETEAGRLSPGQPMTIDDRVRAPSSPVFLHLTGAIPARYVLEAMIAHSDNTATDAVLAAVGPARVRALVTEAGLRDTLLPDSTRRLFSYLAGAPAGADIGWEGMRQMMDGRLPGPPRAPVNDAQTMVSTAADMVRWYQRSLRGDFFSKSATLVEYKRIQAMADAIPQIVPPDTVAYAKGGSIDWEGFHCLCVPGQMIVNKAPVTFCFTINWNGPDDGVPALFQAYRVAVADVLREAADALG